MKKPKPGLPPSPVEWIRIYSWRAQVMLTHALAPDDSATGKQRAQYAADRARYDDEKTAEAKGEFAPDSTPAKRPAKLKPESWRGSLPPPEEHKRARYEELRRAADEVSEFIENADPKTILMMQEYADLYGVAQGVEPGEWYLRGWQPLLKETRKRKANVSKAGKAVRAAKEAKLLTDYQAAPDKAKFKRRLPDRQRRRLRRLLKK